MPKIETTPVQDRYKTVIELNKAVGFPITPEQLAGSTGGDLKDFAGLQRVLMPEDLRKIPGRRSNRLLGVAGMKSRDDGSSPFGAELLLDDVKCAIGRLRRIL